jgi:hypothetical protein
VEREHNGAAEYLSDGYSGEILHHGTHGATWQYSIAAVHAIVFHGSDYVVRWNMLVVLAF